MTKHKRIGFAIGMMLLMGGFGLKWFAEEQQEIVEASEGWRRTRIWVSGESRWGRNEEDFKDPRYDTIPSRYIYAAGIVLMMVGAGVTAFNLPLPESWK